MLLNRDGHRWKFPSRGAVPGALVAQRTELASRRCPLAHFLAVPAQKQVRAPGEVRVAHLAGGRRHGGAIGLRVVLRLLSISEAEEDAQSIGVGGERDLLSVE